MADFTWDSKEDMLEAIGYLAASGVVSSIEATVPIGQREKFREEFEGKYSEEYPYEANKYGRQFRIYLNDTESCPEALQSILDETYGNRINNTKFIELLVKEYGFRFTKEPQNSDRIRDIVFNKHERALFDCFDRGYNGYRDFVCEIETFVNTTEELKEPELLEYKEQSISRRSEKRVTGFSENTAFTSNQMLVLGWVGEEYIAHLLKTKNTKFLSVFGLSPSDNYSFEWYNEGFQKSENLYVYTNTLQMSTGESVENKHQEIVKKWDDKSVGKGCDIVILHENGDRYFLEIKTSKRSYPFFNMTSVEMQEMEKQGKNYYLIKVNNIERLLKNESPDIIAIINPFDKLFHPKQMKDATFVIGGK